MKKLPLLKHILALPTPGQICTASVLQPFLSDFFQTEHPVLFPHFLETQVFYTLLPLAEFLLEEPVHLFSRIEFFNFMISFLV